MGKIELSDSTIDVYIRMGLVRTLSVEHYDWPNGAISFGRLSLLTNNLEPRDEQARIIRESREIVA